MMNMTDQKFTVGHEEEEEGMPDLSEDMHNERLRQGLIAFWTQQMSEMEVLNIATEQDFKNHNDLPLARIKRIMKSDEDVRMISAEAPGNIFNSTYSTIRPNLINIIFHSSFRKSL